MAIAPTIPPGFLPLGLYERADGLQDRQGTATPSYSIKYKTPAGLVDSSGVPIEEHPDSPEIERAEQATLTHRYNLSWVEAINRMEVLGRGAVYTEPSTAPIQGGIPRQVKVLSSKVQRQRGGYASLSVVLEGRNFDNPPDEMRITPVELGVNILKHPRYFYAFLGGGQGSATELKNQMVIHLLQTYFENTTLNYRNAVTKLIRDSLGSEGAVNDTVPEWDPKAKTFTPALISGTFMAKRAALEIIQKYWRGEETPMVTGIELSWTRIHYLPQPLDLGGHIEDPWYATPQFPLEFVSTTEPPDINTTIFNILTYVNPQCYSRTGIRGGPLYIDWLRKPDDVEYQRLWYKIHRTWWGSPVGFWDRDFYSGGNRPQSGYDYNAIN